MIQCYNVQSHLRKKRGQTIRWDIDYERIFAKLKLFSKLKGGINEMAIEKGNENLDNWDDFISGDFLKAINVDSDKDAFIVVKMEFDRESERLRATVERNGKSYLFDVNKTNAVFLKEAGIPNPKELVGKKLYFKKALVRNPQTNKEVEGLRISKVE